jgi:hypothetical protein
MADLLALCYTQQCKARAQRVFCQAGEAMQRIKGSWLFRYVITVSMHGHFRPMPHESASDSRGYWRGAKAGPLAPRYASASSNALASWRSAVSNPSVNQP